MVSVLEQNMDDQTRATVIEEDVLPSYWLDASEDILCDDLIPDFQFLLFFLGQVVQPLLQPMVTPETLPMHPVRELQERCQQQAEGLEYKATRSGNLATVEVYIDGVQVGTAHNAQKKMAQKLAARNALAALKDKESAEANKKHNREEEEEDGKRKNGRSKTFTRQTLNDICLRRNWPMPLYRCVNEGGPAHAKRFTFGVSVNTCDNGWTDECVGEPMPSVKKAKDSAATLLLDLINKMYACSWKQYIHSSIILLLLTVKGLAQLSLHLALS